MKRFTDKVVLITGAGRGLGRALALAFAAEGAIVAANDLTPVNVETTVERIRSRGGRAAVYLGDVSKKMPVQGVFTRLLDDWGGLDVLVNNAAVRPSASLLDLDEWDWQRMLGVNLGGPLLTMQVAGRIFRQQGRGGAVLNIGDAAALSAQADVSAAYAATKAGLAALSRAAARELAPYGVRVNALCPGVLDTNSTRERGALPAAAVSPQTVAEAALFLCSKAAAAINGACIRAEAGGWRQD